MSERERESESKMKGRQSNGIDLRERYLVW